MIKTYYHLIPTVCPLELFEVNNCVAGTNRCRNSLREFHSDFVTQLKNSLWSHSIFSGQAKCCLQKLMLDINLWFILNRWYLINISSAVYNLHQLDQNILRENNESYCDLCKNLLHFFFNCWKKQMVFFWFLVYIFDFFPKNVFFFKELL